MDKAYIENSKNELELRREDAKFLARMYDLFFQKGFLVSQETKTVVTELFEQNDERIKELEKRVKSF